MAGETWTEIRLSDIADVKHGFAFPGENIREEPPGDVLLTPGNFAVGGGFKGDKFKYFDGQVPEEYVLHENDLIVTMTDLSKQADTLGYPALVPKPKNFRYLHNQRLGKVVIRDNARVDKRFLSYLLRSHEYRHEILASATGTTVKHTSPSRILAFKTLLPPPEEQLAIAHILGTLDDKIELNRRMSETLEAMARALFKSWFVDFDPVRAKMDGRWRRGAPLHSPLPAGEGSGVRAALPDRAVVTDSLPADLRDFARELRRHTTDAETLLWRLLRNRLMAGAKFRRQHPLPPYVLDFYCHDAGLAVELDGGQHNEAAGRRHDARRDAFLAQKGIRVLRFWNHEVLNQTEAVLEAIYAAVGQDSSRVEPSPSPPPPLPGGEGRFHLPAHLYDLFPDRLVDSELGEIPEGWEVGRHSDVVEQLRDPENPLSSPDVLFQHFSIPAFDEGQNPKPEYGQSIKSLKSRVPAGTTLLSKLNPEIERVWLVDVRPGERAVCSTEFLVLRARPPFARSFVYCFARSILFRKQIESLVTGTSKSHQRAQVDSILNLEVVMPSSSIVAAFDRSADSLLARTLKCRRESRTLTALRDTMLPKLISGELRVQDAECFVEALL